MKNMVHPGRCRLRRALGAVLLAVCSAAQAQDACEVAMTAGVNFGNLAVLSVPGHQDSNGSITVTCTGADRTVNYTIGLNEGAGSGATVTERKMQRVGGGGDQLSYSLYISSSREAAWGNEAGTWLSGSLSVSNDNGSKSHFVYGRVFGNQSTVRPGSYTDSVTITVTY